MFSIYIFSLELYASCLSAFLDQNLIVYFRKLISSSFKVKVIQILWIRFLWLKVTVILMWIWLSYVGTVAGIMSRKSTIITYDRLFALICIMTGFLTIETSFLLCIKLSILKWVVVNFGTILFPMTLTMTIKTLGLYHLFILLLD